MCIAVNIFLPAITIIFTLLNTKRVEKKVNTFLKNFYAK